MHASSEATRLQMVLSRLVMAYSMTGTPQEQRDSIASARQRLNAMGEVEAVLQLSGQLTAAAEHWLESMEAIERAVARVDAWQAGQEG